MFLATISEVNLNIIIRCGRTPFSNVSRPVRMRRTSPLPQGRGEGQGYFGGVGRGILEGRSGEHPA